jgi:hypothetical protein
MQQEVANVCDNAYAVGVGHPEYHTPFTADDKPELLAQNLAGLFAVNTAIGIISVVREIDVEENVTKVLSDIASDNLTDQEKQITLRLANLSWATCQPFRSDKGPLGRADRVNVFDLLEHDEVIKDYYQIQAAAQYVLDQLVNN